ncbi:MAG: hypothetical protein ACE5I5_05450 [Candidatus Heimdallarchaeota archaeon]
MTTQKDIQNALQELGLPKNDLYDLPPSRKTFPDGTHYRIEISGVERYPVLEALVDEAEKRDVPVHRLICTVQGASWLPKDELEAFARLAAEKKMECIMTPGPRAFWDIGRQALTPEGIISGIRYRGMKGLIQVIEDMRRCIDIGFRGFLVVDEGLLVALVALREKNEIIPKDTVFKVSIFAGHANPAGAQLLEKLGADTFNPVGDLTLPQLAAIRQAVDFPIDIHIVLFGSFGAFNRLYEAPEMTRVTSPCYFKIEPGSSVSGMYVPWFDNSEFIRRKVEYAENLIQLVEKNYPEAKLSEMGASDLAIPRV